MKTNMTLKGITSFVLYYLILFVSPIIAICTNLFNALVGSSDNETVKLINRMRAANSYNHYRFKELYENINKYTSKNMKQRVSFIEFHILAYDMAKENFKRWFKARKDILMGDTKTKFPRLLWSGKEQKYYYTLNAGEAFLYYTVLGLKYSSPRLLWESVKHKSPNRKRKHREELYSFEKIISDPTITNKLEKLREDDALMDKENSWKAEDIENLKTCIEKHKENIAKGNVILNKKDNKYI